ncbi:hypothetical protein JB92DRAFT_2835801 [Gautieria morchelliformis]|nr:hypothetical protein JB92DRAFT_2835801 [Gautieria morchelliformis]
MPNVEVEVAAASSSHAHAEGDEGGCGRRMHMEGGGGGGVVACTRRGRVEVGVEVASPVVPLIYNLWERLVISSFYFHRFHTFAGSGGMVYGGGRIRVEGVDMAPLTARRLWEAPGLTDPRSLRLKECLKRREGPQVANAGGCSLPEYTIYTLGLSAVLSTFEGNDEEVISLCVLPMSNEAKIRRAS